LKDKRAKAFRQILSDAVREKLAAGICPDTILPLFRETLAFSQTLISELEASGDSPAVACKSGCFLCCHSRVSVIPLEALLMAEFVAAKFSRSQVDELVKRIHRAHDLTQGKTDKQIYTLKTVLPCVFLEGGRCSVYEARPSICRAWNAFDAADCRSAYDSADYRARVASSPARRLVFGAARDLFQQLSVESVLQHHTLTLCDAMADCLLSSDPLVSWARGDDIFHYN
jgi:Fe-S-cluster containining protein